MVGSVGSVGLPPLPSPLPSSPPLPVVAVAVGNIILPSVRTSSTSPVILIDKYPDVDEIDMISAANTRYVIKIGHFLLIMNIMKGGCDLRIIYRLFNCILAMMWFIFSETIITIVPKQIGITSCDNHVNGSFVC